MFARIRPQVSRASTSSSTTSAKYRKVSPYSGGLFSDDIHSSYKPKNEDDSKFVQSLLREFTIDEDGIIHWSTFEGLVRGTPAETPYCRNNGVGYFTRAEGLAELKRIQAFWDQYEGDPDYAKVDNHHRQPSEMSISMKIWIRDEKLGITDDEDEPKGLALPPSPPPPPQTD